MTQIISVTRRYTVIQVSDRELTWSTTGQVADRRSNKAIIVVTGEAAATIGYAGRASIAGMPTDDWIAGAICSPLGQEWSPPAAPNDLGRLNVGHLVERLGTRVGAYRTALSTNEMLDFRLRVQVVGWRDHGALVEAFAFEVRADKTSPIVQAVMHRDRGVSLRHARLLATPRLPRAEDSALRQDLASSMESPDAVREVLSMAMARAAERSGIGKEHLCVQLQPSGDPPIRLRFESPEQRHDFIPGPAGNHPVSYTPWLLTPHGVIGPLVCNFGELGFEGTPVRVVIDGLPSTTPPFSMMAGARDRRYSVTPFGQDIQRSFGPRSG